MICDVFVSSVSKPIEESQSILAVIYWLQLLKLSCYEKRASQNEGKDETCASCLMQRHTTRALFSSSDELKHVHRLGSI